VALERKEHLIAPAANSVRRLIDSRRSVGYNDLRPDK
jgi:hypothetical protein